MKNITSGKIVIVAIVLVFLASCTVSTPSPATLTVQDGVITGELGFPSDQIPPLRVTAIDVESGGVYTIDTELNQKVYSLPVPPGSYHVIAYLLEGDSDFAGGYTEFVPCGLRADCPSHDLITISVEAGEIVVGVVPMDWYAPPGSFPPRPNLTPQGTEATPGDLESNFLADLDITLVGPDDYDGFNDVGTLLLEGAEQNLWATFTLGMRSFDEDTPQAHVIAIYAREAGNWRLIAHTVLTESENSFGPDYLGNGSVRQVQVEPDNIWIEIQGGVGAHGGTYHLLRFDGEQLITEAAWGNASPGGSEVSDINNDGIAEVLLDATDYYVFCYACGVRYLHYNVLYWDGERMVPVQLTLLPETAPDALRIPNNQAVELAEAGLWEDAMMAMGHTLAQSASPPGKTTLWNNAFIKLNGSIKQKAAQSTDSFFPILDNLFYGDYSAAVSPFRAYTPTDIFTQPSALVTDTVAEGYEVAVYETIMEWTDKALAILVEENTEQRAAAHFLRAWAAFLHDPADPEVLSNLEKSTSLSPEDSLYSDSYGYFLQTP